MILISFLTGHFKNLFYFTLIIIIHELGHSIAGLILKFKLRRIEIYPYGGCSKLEYDINTPLIKEFLVLIMGPLTQIIFAFIIKLSNINIPSYFFDYHYFILIFNLFPIYPLDGGKLLNILMSYLLSFYNSLKYSLYISYFLFIIIFILEILFIKNLLFSLIFLLLGIKIFKEINKVYYYYQKFLLERYLKIFEFNKIKKVSEMKQMKRDYYHIFKINNDVISEEKILSNYFCNSLFLVDKNICNKLN